MSPDPRAPAADAEKRRKDRIELIAAVIIGVAAILTAVATFQEGDVDATIAEKQTESIALTLFANDAYNDAAAQQAIERDWFFTFITEAQNETPAAAYLALAMPPEVGDLTDQWLASTADIGDPFSPEGAELYDAYTRLPSVQLLLLGVERDVDATCATLAVQILQIQGDNFGLASVFLAISLVVGGIAALLRRPLAQYIVLFVSIASLLVGASLLLLGTDEAESRIDAAPDFAPILREAELLDLDAGASDLEVLDAYCPAA